VVFIAVAYHATRQARELTSYRVPLIIRVMKRSAELRDLSEQHHYGLVASRALRLAAEGARPLGEAVAAFRRAWEAEIQPHFRLEEEILLPELARVLPADDPLIIRTLVEHVALRRAAADLFDAPDPARAGEAARLLHDHIRFEERVLFPTVEERLEGQALAAVGEALARAHAPHACGRDGSSLEA
jgi:hypothetical protein